MNGCQWDSDSGEIDGYKMYGYDGEDFLSLDLKNMRWIAHVPQAAASKDKRDANVTEFQAMKRFFHHECIDKLKEYVGYGKCELNWKGTVPHITVILFVFFSECELVAFLSL